MVIISKKAIIDFYEDEPSSKEALLTWYREAKAADWANFSDVKKTFNTADSAGNGLYIFNITVLSQECFLTQEHYL